MKLEAELIRRACYENEEEAWTELVNQTRGWLIDFIRKRCGFEAEDLANEAFINAFRHRAQLETPDCFLSWLGQITSRLIYSEGRRKRLPQVELNETTIPTPFVKDQLAQLIEAEENEQLRTRIRALPNEPRKVVVLRTLGYRYAQIGEELGITEVSAKTTYYRAINTLRNAGEK